MRLDDSQRLIVGALGASLAATDSPPRVGIGVLLLTVALHGGRNPKGEQMSITAQPPALTPDVGVEPVNDFFDGFDGVIKGSGKWGVPVLTSDMDRYKAHQDGKINCDSITFYGCWDDLPDRHKAIIGQRIYTPENFIVAEHGERRAFICMAPQLIERAPLEMVASICCQDLSADLAGSTTA